MMRDNFAIVSMVIRAALIVAVMGSLSAFVNAQDATIVEAVATNKPNATPAGWRVFITFSKPFDASNEALARDPGKYSVFHVASKSLVTIHEARIAKTRSGKEICSMVELRVDPLTVGDYYQFFVSSMSGFVPKPLASQIQFTSITSTTDDEPSPGLPLTGAEDREDANIYVSGELTRASGSDFVGSADLKFSYPVPADFWGRSHFFEPVFDLKWSSDPEADPDTMKFGLDWAFLAKKRSGGKKWFSQVWWKNSFLVEAERDFDNANFTWGSRFIAPSKVFDNDQKTARAYVRPFVGVEVGKNIKSPVPEAEGKGIARGVFGSSLNLRFPLKRKHLDSISLEASYIRRLLMLREIYFEKAEDDSLRPVFFARNPRDWVDSKLSFNLSDSFGFYVGYEYGQEPPSFKLVDHRMKLGLIYKVKFKKPEE